MDFAELCDLQFAKSCGGSSSRTFQPEMNRIDHGTNWHAI